MRIRSAFVAFGLLAACGEATTEHSGLQIPEGFPDMLVPESNPATAEKVELGRHLFYDKRLSKNELQSCGSCHEQARGFSDGLKTPLGSTGAVLVRNSQGLANVGYNATLTWANPLLTELEVQLLIPIFGEDPIELGATGAEEEIIARLQADPIYTPLFAAAFPDEGEVIDWDHVVKALATFCRSLISGNSAFDRFVYRDDKTALDQQERHGLELFFSERLECHHCHGGFNFTESTVHADTKFDSALFHNTGLYNIDGSGGLPEGNRGVFDITQRPEDMGRFRPQSLRNIEVTGPYMHDGSIETLEEVVRFYEDGGRLITDGPYAGDGRASPLKSGLVPGFTLSDEGRAALIAFLKTLTDDTFLSDPRFSDPWPSQPN